MIKYFETTCLILTWCLLGAALWVWINFELVSRYERYRRFVMRHTVLDTLPTLIVVPVTLVACFRLFEINLIFPVHLFADFWQIGLAAIVPAMTLLLVSGLLLRVPFTLAHEYQEWSSKEFVRMASAVGLNPRRALRRLIIAKVFLGVWLQSLPWLFGEIVLIESLFNAPGLGLEAWHFARMRSYADLAGSVFWLSLIYLIVGMACYLLNRWLGRKLESYA